MAKIITADRAFGASGPRRLGLLVALLALCFGVAALGGLVTSTSVDTWYRTLTRLAFTPPDWVFGPVWSALYAMMALAAWLVWRRAGWERGRGALALFFVQLALNLAWSILFFGLNAIGAALIDIIVLWLLILATTIAFWRIDRRGGWLLLPYLVWVGYAAALNAAIWWMN